MAKIITNQTVPSPIGLTLPIQNGSNGYFQQSFDTLTQVKTNITNLLKTRQGERRFQPTFGSRLWNLVFEQNLDTLETEASNIITQDIQNWIPNVTVQDVTATLLTTDQINTNTDMYMLKIIVNFQINVSKQSDTVILVINNGMPLIQ